MTDTIEGRLRTALPDLTRAERQLVTHILRNYPVSALGSITTLALVMLFWPLLSKLLALLRKPRGPAGGLADERTAG